ncbi:unnamed protein product [Aphanomyces euteiches]
MYYPAFGDWKSEWHGLRVLQVHPELQHATERFFMGGTHESFLGHRFHFTKNPRAYYKDYTYVLINMPWPWFILRFLLGCIVFTTFFALVYSNICQDTDDFQDAFNLSFQSFATIGYGIVYPRNTCAQFTLCAEAFCTVIFMSVLTGLVFAKFSKPKSTAVFSKQCAIQPYGNDLALVIRVANATRSHHIHHDAILEAAFTANLMRIEQKSAKDTALVMRRYELEMLQSNFLVFRRDIQLVHIIDEASPLFGLTAEQCAQSDFAIQVDVIGVEATSQSTMQDRQLYTAQDFEWGAKFVDMFSAEKNRLVMDFKLLSVTTPVPMDRTPLPTAMSFFPSNPSTHAAMPSSFANVSFVGARPSMDMEYRPSKQFNGRRRDFPMMDLLAQSLLENEEPVAMSFLRMDGHATTPSRDARTSRASSVALVEDAPIFDYILPRNLPFAYSFHTFYTDSLKMSWPKIIIYLLLAYVVLNLIFAGLFFAEMDNVFLAADVAANNSNFSLCVFYSVQTISTIGYGVVGPQPSSDYQNFIVTMESVVGIVFVTIFTGIAWAKFARPRAHVAFGDHVVITTIDGHRVLLLRALNLRSHGDISGNTFRVGVSETNKRTGLRQVHELELLNASFPSINVPVTLIHVIDDSSPFYKFTKDEDFLELNLQLMCLYSGIDHTFSANVYARKVYFSHDILLHECFVECVDFTPKGVTIHYDDFRQHAPMDFHATSL